MIESPSDASADLIGHGAILHLRVTTLHNGRCEHNRDCIIQNGLAKHQHVQNWVNVQCLQGYEG